MLNLGGRYVSKHLHVNQRIFFGYVRSRLKDFISNISLELLDQDLDGFDFLRLHFFCCCSLLFPMFFVSVEQFVHAHYLRLKIGDILINLVGEDAIKIIERALLFYKDFLQL